MYCQRLKQGDCADIRHSVDEPRQSDQVHGDDAEDSTRFPTHDRMDVSRTGNAIDTENSIPAVAQIVNSTLSRTGFPASWQLATWSHLCEFALNVRLAGVAIISQLQIAASSRLLR